MDFKQWIYSPDIARWLSEEGDLGLVELTDCILSAPHRTLGEKLEGLRKLLQETKGERRQEGGDGNLPCQTAGEGVSWVLEFLDKKIEMGETLDEILHMVGGFRNLYETDIFCHGNREEWIKRRIFSLPQPGIQFIREQIKETADRYGTGTDSFFGVLRKFYRRGVRYLDLEWNILLNPDGEVIYCLPETDEAEERGDYRIGPGDYYYLKLPYPSGTLVETMASPFFPAIKGVLVNQVEPWEEGFVREADQWLVYGDSLHGSQGNGIGVIPLNHYASFNFGADFILPFVQFLKKYGGTLSKSERWLGELGELVRKDKSCFALILRDRQLGKQPKGETDRPREYVRELEKRLRQRETKTLAREKREMENVLKRKGG
ncbi:hypothetical protein D5274_13505 [bacterium 1XD42-94]|nr:hypothetical protein [bacterium 1XD42-76]NBK06129.1 hypothetical protein [bacterium 1XD42-94]